MSVAAALRTSTRPPRGEVQRVVDQVRQRLPDEEALAADVRARGDAVAQRDVRASRAGLEAREQIVDERHELDRRALLEPAALLDQGEMQQTLAQLLQAFGLGVDVPEKTLPLFGRELTPQHFGCAVDAGERPLELVRQRLDIALHVRLAFELNAHALERARQVRARRPAAAAPPRARRR